MNILTKITTFIKSAFSGAYVLITMSIIIVTLAVLLFSKCSSLSEEKLNHERDNAMYENNIKAQNDSLVTIYNKKLGQSVTEKTSYLIKSVDDLSKYNENLYNEFKDLKTMVAGIKSNVSIIIPALTSKIDAPLVDSKDSAKFIIPWNFNYSDLGLTQRLVGKTQFKILNNKPASPIISTLDSNRFSIGLKYSVIERDGKYIVQASSLSNLVTFNELDGVLMLDKVVPAATTSNPWGFGPYIGFGIGTGIVGQTPRFGWNVGVGITYNLFSKLNGAKGIKSLFNR